MPINLRIHQPEGAILHKLELHINGNFLNADSDYIAHNIQTQAEEFAALHYFFSHWLRILENQTEGILPFDLSDQYIGYLYFAQTENRFRVEYRYTTDGNGAGCISQDNLENCFLI